MGDFSRGKWVTFLVGEIIDISLSMESLLLREKYPFSPEVKLRIFFQIYTFLLNPFPYCFAEAWYQGCCFLSSFI